MRHHCHAKGCPVPVPPKMLMCTQHWYMVPKDLQAAVWHAYRPGQEVTKDPTREYLDAATAAIAAVAAAEARRGVPALTVSEPYASLIIFAGKDVENRTWPTGYRGPLVIHAGKTSRYLPKKWEADWAEYRNGWPALPVAPAFGQIVGVVDVVGCLELADAPTGPWTEGPWCWMLANPRPLPAPVDAVGKQGLWKMPDDIAAAVAAQTAERGKN